MAAITQAAVSPLNDLPTQLPTTTLVGYESRLLESRTMPHD